MRILWLKTDLLHPVITGGRIRTYQMLRALKQEHHITYVALEEAGTANDQARRLASEYCHDLTVIPHPMLHPKGTLGLYGELGWNLGSTLPHFVAKFRSTPMRQFVQSRLDLRKDDVLVCDFLSASVNVPTGTLPIPAILFEHNVEAIVWKRLAEVEKRQPHRWYLQRQWKKAVAYEATACRRFDTVIAVSPEDAERIRRDYGASSVDCVPLGVDLDYFKRRPEAPPPRPRSLVFTGSMDWLANDDGMCWFLESVWPAICKAAPDASVTIVGREPGARLQQLARGAPGDVRVTGRVEDVRPHVESAVAFIVPLRVGGGTRLKIYEALAMGKPVISTTIGAEGLPLKDGVHLLLADSEEAFAAAVLKIFQDTHLADTLSSQGAELVHANYGWSNAAKVFAAICDQVTRKSPAPMARLTKSAGAE